MIIYKILSTTTKKIVNNIKNVLDIETMFIWFTILSQFILSAMQQVRFYNVFSQFFLLKYNVFNVVQYCLQCFVLSKPCASAGTAGQLKFQQNCCHSSCPRRWPKTRRCSLVYAARSSRHPARAARPARGPAIHC